MSELPDWTLPYISENYTGPWLSDGKIQSSVANGKSKPKSKLDALSREHDTAYAVHKDRKNRYQADLVYQRGTEKIGGFVPRAAGYAVRYLNQLGDGNHLRDTVGNLRGSLIGGGGVNMSKYQEFEVKPNDNVYLPEVYFRGSVPKKITQPPEPVADPYDVMVDKKFGFKKAPSQGQVDTEEALLPVYYRPKRRRRRRK